MNQPSCRSRPPGGTKPRQIGVHRRLSPAGPTGPTRRGLVLILVLIVIAMLSLGAYSFTNLMLAHHEAAVITGRQAQTRSLVDSGVTAVQLFLSQSADDRAAAGGIYDNAQHFRAVTVLEDDNYKDRGCFSVIAPGIDSDGNVSGIRHGLEDESTRLNLNVLLILDKQSPGSGRTLLMGLPGMTEDVADAILDWLDPDDDQRELGSEVEYYSSLSPAYAPKNGPVDTVEELLLVKGVTPQLLFGADSNRNGQLDQHELTQDTGDTVSTDATGFRGWSSFLTIYSVEWNITPDGNPKVYLNTNDLNKLVDDLGAAGLNADWINFIVAYRQAGPSGGGGGGGGAAAGAAGATTTGTAGAAGAATAGATTPGNTPVAAGSGELNMDLQPQTTIGSILDLVGAQVQYTFQGGMAPSTLASPFADGAYASYLPQLMDYVTVNPAATIPGRININQCSSTVLSGIPGMTSDISSKILAQRTIDSTSADPARKYETWLLSESIVTLPQMKILMPFINGGGNAYRAQIVGYFQGGQAASRVEAVFDATSPLPRIVLWRDLTHLGRGYPLDTLGVNYSQ
ncbi:MAG TPA: type II secretion system protein GspK [Pirellulaceae bacterium]